jgi:hypothetical protein
VDAHAVRDDHIPVPNLGRRFDLNLGDRHRLSLPDCPLLAGL